MFYSIHHFSKNYGSVIDFICKSNKNTNEVFGARDFFGIKPLYYAKMGETLMWGSEIKSFLDHPHFKKELNTDVLETYLTFQYSC